MLFTDISNKVKSNNKVFLNLQNKDSTREEKIISIL